MRLLSWNVNYRVARTSDQVALCAAQQPDIIALQEVNRNATRAYHEHFHAAGYPYVADSFDGMDAALLTGRRTRGVLVASRWAFAVTPPAFDVPWHERVQSVTIHSPFGSVALHNVYIPTGGARDPADRWRKIETLEGLYAGLSCPCPHYRILCGDLNAPQHETADGEVITFGQALRRGGQAGMIGAWGARWDRGERLLLTGLAEHDLVDVFRALHGYGVEAFSWYPSRGHGFRLDHVFASRGLNPVTCVYLDGFRTGGLSDHAAMLAAFAPAG